MMRSTKEVVPSDRVDDVVIRTEQLTKVYPGGLKAVDDLDLVGAAGRDLRPARPERRRQDHDRRDAHHARRSRPAGTAFVGGIDVVAHPAAAKQVIGVVPQTNTLDRSLDVWENLYFHGRFFGMTRQDGARPRPTGCSSSSGSPTGPTAPVLALSGGMAQRLMVARAIMHRPADAVPRRADRRPRSAEPHRAVGDPRRAPRRRPDDPAHHALHGGGRPALRPGRDHRPRPAPRPRHAGRAQALDRRRHRWSPCRADGDLDAARRRARSRDRRARTDGDASSTAPSSLGVHGADGRAARASFNAAERHGFTVTDLSVTEPTLETVFINLTGKDLRE